MKSAFVLLASYLAAGDPQLVKIDGEAELARTLYQVQLANSTRYPRGEMHSTSKVSRSFDGSTVTTHCRLQWDGEITAWRMRTQGVYPNHPTMYQGETESLHLRTTDTQYHLRLGGGVLRFKIYKLPFPQLQRSYRLRPEDAWYAYDQQVPWHKLWHASRFPETEHLFECRREEDIVTMSHYIPKKNFRGEIVFSMAQGGNIISYDSGKAIDPDKPIQTTASRRGTYKWAKHGDRDWVLEKCTMVNRSLHDEKEYHEVTEITVDSFDPNPTWTADDLLPERFFPIPPTAPKP